MGNKKRRSEPPISPSEIVQAVLAIALMAMYPVIETGGRFVSAVSKKTAEVAVVLRDKIDKED